ncbi:hypothetical protein CRG98_036305, partial [Punica granatum]
MGALNVLPASSSLVALCCHGSLGSTSSSSSCTHGDRLHSVHVSAVSSSLFSHHKKPKSSPISHTHLPRSGILPSSRSPWSRTSTTHLLQRQGLIYCVFPSTPAQVSSVEDLFDFICLGPLLSKVGLTKEKVAESIDKWLAYGLHLCRLFQVNELCLTVPEKVRFYHYYVPVFLWCEDQIAKHQSKFKDVEDAPPLVIGFSAPQGCGKTTLVFALNYLFRVTGRKSATLSIDDFYLTAESQAKVREENPGNALLE